MPFTDDQIAEAFGETFPRNYGNDEFNTHWRGLNPDQQTQLKQFLKNVAVHYPNLAHTRRRFNDRNISVKIGIGAGARVIEAIVIKKEERENIISISLSPGVKFQDENQIRIWPLGDFFNNIGDFIFPDDFHLAAFDLNDGAGVGSFVCFPIGDPRRGQEVGQQDGLEPETEQGPPPVSQNFPKNIILYGPPGTGKTFATTALALYAANGQAQWQPEQLQQAPQPDQITSYQRLVNQKQIRFVTFHQSYTYEDFVEGISAKTDADGKIIYYQKPGAFKKIAASALSAWLNPSGAQQVDEEDPKSLTEIFASAHEAVTNPNSAEAEGDRQPTPFVLIIDEINRGNVAKIFGELITLIEESKRAKRQADPAAGDQPTGARLPLSGDTLYVPPNLYIIGTMNTADRSLVGMDMAMRRRFEFVELAPNPDLLSGINLRNGDVALSLRDFLAELNSRISSEDSPDHAIGHAYLMGVTNQDALIKVMKNKIIPQLRENMIGREAELRKILSKDRSGNNSLVDESGRPVDQNLNVLLNYPGARVENAQQ